MKTRDVKMFDGMVACPLQGHRCVDVETCYRCPRLRGFYDTESETRVLCAVPWLRTRWARRLPRQHHGDVLT
jgi:hypothetical protein